MKWHRSLACIVSLCAFSVGCSDGTDGAPSGDGGTGSDGGSGASTSGGGSGNSSGSDGGSTSGGGSGAGGSGGGTSDDLDELLVDARELCTPGALSARVQYADRDIANIVEGPVTNVTETPGGSEASVEIDTILGHVVRLTYPGTAQPGDRVEVSGFVHDEDGAESRDRCFLGEVDVRVDIGGETFFIFASQTLFEATTDGTCGAETTDETTLGCFSMLD